MSELPEAEDLSFLHSGLCQTCLPHRKHSVPLDKRAIAELKGNNLALDLYTLSAYRLRSYPTRFI